MNKPAQPTPRTDAAEFTAEVIDYEKRTTTTARVVFAEFARTLEREAAPAPTLAARRPFKQGDTVIHQPSGETWYLIKDESEGWVTPGGWPPSQGRAEDCTLAQATAMAPRSDNAQAEPLPGNPALALRCIARK